MNNKLIAVFVAAALTQAAMAQSGADSATGADALEQVVVTGTRVANRSALDTPVPVDVIPADTLQNLGVTEINQALSVALPSFNFPRPGLTDGTDTVRPATLRGLAPDQTLVLVNGKRRHSAALVNVNGTIGRGAASADLNTIPNNAISAIEVLRDGASAQYGSDAIAASSTCVCAKPVTVVKAPSATAGAKPSMRPRRARRPRVLTGRPRACCSAAVRTVRRSPSAVGRAFLWVTLAF